MKKIVLLFVSFLGYFSVEAQHNIYSYGQYGTKSKKATTNQNHQGGTDVYQYGQ